MSTVVLDTITGKSTATTITIGSTPVVSASANSMTIRGEGTAQTSIQQGLCKSWINLTGTGTIAVNDSFNISSVTDIGTGNYRAYYTSNMSNVNYSVDISGAAATAGAAASGKIISSYTEHNLANSVGISCFNVAGDLA
jgi:hypothetical protein